MPTSKPAPTKRTIKHPVKKAVRSPRLLSKAPFSKPLALLVAFGFVGLGYMATSAFAANPPILGPDTSHHNPYLDTGLAYRQGYRFQIMKASEGMTFKDNKFGTSLANAKRNNIIPGAYHFLHRGNASAQADTFVNYVKRYNGGSTKGVMFMLDVEKYSSSYPRYSDVTTFVARFKQLVPNRTLIVYTGKWFWGSSKQRGYLGNPRAPSGTVLAVSMYTTCTGDAHSMLRRCITPQGAKGEPYAADPINGWSSYFFRQFSDRARIANFTGDANVTYKGMTALKALTGSSSTTPTPTPTPTPGSTKNPYESACPQPEPSISQGDSGNCVKKLQWMLNKVQNANLTIDGQFGAATNKHVLLFQGNKSLKKDGIVGSVTWTALHKAAGTPK